MQQYSFKKYMWAVCRITKNGQIRASFAHQGEGFANLTSCLTRDSTAGLAGGSAQTPLQDRARTHRMSSHFSEEVFAYEIGVI